MRSETDTYADKGVADLLDLYDLPFVPTMFLYEKKAIYLRFVSEPCLDASCVG
jgi:hypothetical protein